MSSTKQDKCFICSCTLKDVGYNSTSNCYQITCPRCGVYECTDEVMLKQENFEFTIDQMAIISGYLNNISNTIKTINDIDSIIAFGFPSPVERSEIVLKYFEKLTTYLGGAVKYDELRLQAISYSRNASELKYIINNYLSAQKYIDYDRNDLIIAPKGWAHLTTLKERKIDSKFAFCAMWFYPAMDNYFSAINKTVTKCGFELLRVDMVEHNNKICDEIITKIKQSKFVIADFTGQRGGVYFEAGFALGYKIPVIYTCKQDELKDLHFDVRQFNTILWDEENLTELENKLSNRIYATII